MRLLPLLFVAMMAGCKTTAPSVSEAKSANGDFDKLAHLADCESQGIAFPWSQCKSATNRSGQKVAAACESERGVAIYYFGPLSPVKVYYRTNDSHSFAWSWLKEQDATNFGGTAGCMVSWSEGTIGAGETSGLELYFMDDQGSYDSNLSANYRVQ